MGRRGVHHGSRWWRRLGVVLALLLVVGCGLALQYRGLTLALWRHATGSATWTESWNLLRACHTWLTFMEKLEADPETGTYDFPSRGLPSGVKALESEALLDIHRGDFRQAIVGLESVIAQKGATESRRFWLAMAHLRQAELVNCHGPSEGLHTHGSRCALPLAAHTETTHGETARQLFEALAHNHDDPLYRWLANLGAMTVGDYPEGVDAALRITSPLTKLFHGEAGRSSAARWSHLRLVDRAAELGVATDDAGRGVAVEDFDGDGDLDLVTGGSFDTLRFYRNQDGRGFVDHTEAVGLADVTQPFVITAADIDNDGWVDLFVARPFDRFRLFRNRGDGTFEDFTQASGLLDAKNPESVAATWVSAWGDLDLDGDLDLFLAQWGFRLPGVRGLMARPRMASTLFLNQGDGRFVDGTEAWGLADVVRDQYFLGAAVGDADNDGWPELFLSSPLRGTSLLLHNRDGQRFDRHTRLRHEGGFVTAWIDIDHDGRLDLFQSGFADARTSAAQAIAPTPLGWRSGNSTLFHQQADGRFRARDDLFGGGTLPLGTMGASYGDLDNDGCADFYLGTGSPESWFLLPNLLMLGERQGTRCTGRMENLSQLSGVGTLQKGHGIVFFDFDEDGDQDIYSALGGMWPGDRWPNQLFVNESTLDTAWIKLRLRGRQTNRLGVGARLRIEAVDADGRSIVRHHHIDNTTGFGSAPYRAHIGLAEAVALRCLEVRWPSSRCRHDYAPSLGDALQATHILDEADCLEARKPPVAVASLEGIP